MRDKSREKMCLGLQQIGIEAHLGSRGEPREGKGSIGTISVCGTLISWVDVRRIVKGSGEHKYTESYIDYGVSCPDIPDCGHVKVWSEKISEFPYVWKTIDSRWNGDDGGSGILRRLNDDQRLKYPLMHGPDVKVNLDIINGCWKLTVQTSESPSREDWTFYERIAAHLLEAVGK
jgi:hypothetical protein